MKENRIALQITSPELAPKCQDLAKKLSIPMMSQHEGYDYLLLLTPNYLGIKKAADTRSPPFYLDFCTSKLRYRIKQANLRNELLARAIGISPKDHPRIIDATAGLGRDSFLLAALGYQVTMLERSPIIHALLQDAFARATLDGEMAPIIGRLNLIHADAIDWLEKLPHNEYPDVVYLDPMFPSRQKAASVKKEMAFMQDLLGKDQDVARLFQAAVSCSKKRIVVKRPKYAENVGEREPNFSYRGNSSRFDIYLTR